MLIEAYRRTQRDLDAAIGDAELADRLAYPVIVRELSNDEARRLWPDWPDTEPAFINQGE